MSTTIPGPSRTTRGLPGCWAGWRPDVPLEAPPAPAGSPPAWPSASSWSHGVRYWPVFWMITPCGLGPWWRTSSTPATATTSDGPSSRSRSLLSEMDDLPSSLPHGDAAPVNLLRPVGEPDTLVAIDWAFGCQLPLGFDLGQLLVGEAEGGRVDPGDLAALLDVILPAYADGLRDEGVDVPEATLRRGLVCSLGTRTLWGAYPFEDTEGPASEEQVAQLRLRAAFGRFVLDQVLAG